MRYAIISICMTALAVASAAYGEGASVTASAPTAARAWPTDSLHHLDVPLETSRGERTSLASTAGRVRIVTYFYATCPMMCPLTIDTLRNVDAALTPEERSRLRVMLVTMDPEQDTPQALHDLAKTRKLDESRWILARTSKADTRELAGALGIQYRQLDDGEFDHSGALILLDAQGRALARSSQMGKPDPQFVAAVRKALAK